MSERLGERIHRLRLKTDQSLQQVADAVGAAKAHVWQIEKGRADNPSIQLVKRLADHFGVSVGYLVDEDADAPEVDDDIRRMFRQAHELDPTDRATLDNMMKHFLERKRAAR